MYYSTPKAGGDNRSTHSQDWTCSKCGYHNFKRRDHCFKCNISKEESERAKEGDGFDQVGNNPCNTLIFRGLDALTIEENMIGALSKVTALAVKNIQVIRDELTGTSRGYGFVEMSSIQDSSNLLETLHNLQPFEVDGKAIIVSYAKNTFSTVLATMNNTNQTTTSTADYTQYNYDAHGGYYDEQGGYYDAAGTYYPPGSFDYSSYYATSTASGSSTQTDSTNAAAAVAQAAIQQAYATKSKHTPQTTAQAPVVHEQTWDVSAYASSTGDYSSSYSQHTVADTTATQSAIPQVSATEQVSSYQKYPVPDVSTYQYDESSGYYYDAVTSLYYDATTQYYYNAQTGQFMYWDGEHQTYFPSPGEGQDAQSGDLGSYNGKNDGEKCGNKDKDKKEKVKVAKKIAKDMAKWAKSMNAQKNAFKSGNPLQGQVVMPMGGEMIMMRPPNERSSLTADAGFAILEKANKVEITIGKKKDDKKMPPPAAGGLQPGLVASYGGDSGDEEEVEEEDGPLDESKFTDYSKMACLLCKRQFPNKDGLQRHQQMSDLHKKNIEDYRKTVKPSSSSGGALGMQQYRDRAKERRQKFGAPEPPLPKNRGKPPPEAPVPYEQPTKAGIGSDNIGSKLMKKMGWNSGMGLGKANQGRVDPIQAERRLQQAGLGASGSKYTNNVQPGDTYKEAVKKTMFARYRDMSDD